MSDKNPLVVDAEARASGKSAFALSLELAFSPELAAEPVVAETTLELEWPEAAREAAAASRSANGKTNACAGGDKHFHAAQQASKAADDAGADADHARASHLHGVAADLLDKSAAFHAKSKVTPGWAADRKKAAEAHRIAADSHDYAKDKDSK